MSSQPRDDGIPEPRALTQIGDSLMNILRGTLHDVPHAKKMKEEVLERWRSKVGVLVVLFLTNLGGQTTGVTDGYGGTGK